MTTQTEDPPDRQWRSTSRQEMFEQFFREHHLAAIRYAIRRGLVESDAKEIAADALRVVWQKCQTIDESAIPFLYQTCRNLVQHVYRERLRRTQAENRARRHQEFATTRTTPSDEASRLHDAVASLGDPGTEIIRLLYWDGLPAAQVAIITNSTEQAVWAQASRSRRKLAQILKGNHHED